jgi:hypothetical protein
MTQPLPEPTCDKPACQSDDPSRLHSGYVYHRRRGETACARSTAGHRIYTQQRRDARRQTERENQQ